jgi:hypothetical protein
MSFIKILLPVALAGAAVFALSTGEAHAKAPADKRLSDKQAKEVEDALRTADPRVLRELALELERAGFKQQARDLREAADAIANAVKNVPPVKAGDKPVITTSGTPITSPGVTQQAGSNVPELPSGAKLLAGKTALMLTNSSPGRENKQMVKDYQLQEQENGHSAVGKADGLYGPKTALTMARHYNIVPPKPYYWPRQSQAQAKADYRSQMLSFATKDPPRAEEWRAAGRV